MSKHTIIDNFLPEASFKALQEFFLSTRMPWYFFDHVAYDDDAEKTDANQFQFVHTMYIDDAPRGIGTDILKPIFAQLNPFTLLRAKINLTPKRGAIIHSPYHYDDADFTEAKLPYTVGIFYLNTNDGFTILEDGTQIESVANRMVLLAGDVKHTGTTAMSDRRVVLNLNFIYEHTLKHYEKT